MGSSFCTLLARAQFALQTAQSNAVSLTGHAEDGFLLQVCGVFKDTNVNFHKEKCFYLLFFFFLAFKYKGTEVMFFFKNSLYVYA